MQSNFFLFLNYIAMHTITLTRANITNSDNNTMSYDIPGSVNLEGSEIALSNLYMYYSWENINAAPLGNNVLYIMWPQLDTDNAGNPLAAVQPPTNIPITIPAGIYEASDLNAYFQQFCILNNLYLINSTTGEYVYFIQLQANATRYALQFNSFSLPTSAQMTGYAEPPGGFCGTSTFLPNAAGGGFPSTSGTAPGWAFPSKFADWAGFADNYQNPPGTIFAGLPTATAFTGLAAFPTGNTSFLSTTTPEVNPNPVIYLNCNLIQNKYSTPQTFMYPIPAKSGIAQLLSIEVSEFAWNKMTPGQAGTLRLFFTDVDGQPIKILDPNIIVTLVIKDLEDQNMKMGASGVGNTPHSMQSKVLMHHPARNDAGGQHSAVARRYETT